MAEENFQRPLLSLDMQGQSIKEVLLKSVKIEEVESLPEASENYNRVLFNKGELKYSNGEKWIGQAEMVGLGLVVKTNFNDSNIPKGQIDINGHRATLFNKIDNSDLSLMPTKTIKGNRTNRKASPTDITYANFARDMRDSTLLGVTLTTKGGVYILKQGDIEVGRFSASSFVDTIELVQGYWSKDKMTFTEDKEGTDLAMKLTIKKELDPSIIYLDVSKLIDVYNGGTTDTINVRIEQTDEGYNVLAEIKNYSIKKEHLSKELNTEIEEAISTAQIQADWNQTDATQKGFIKNKPSLNQVTLGVTTGGTKVGLGKVYSPSNENIIFELSKVASSGSYEDLNDKPIVPFVSTSNTLADAVAEVPIEERCVGKIVEFTDANGNNQKYKYMGKYYTDEDWNATTTIPMAWLDVNSQDKYIVTYFRLTPTREGEIRATIDSNGNITENASGTSIISDYLEIPENGVTITGGWFAKYVLYDENKSKLLTNVLYGGKTFNRTNGRYVRVTGALNWKIGQEKGTSSTTPPRKQHVEVIPKYESLVDYFDADGWSEKWSPFIRLRKGETITMFSMGSDTVSADFIAYQKYDLEYNTVENPKTERGEFTMTNDGYVKIGSQATSTTLAYIYAKNILSKSVARTTAKKRLLVVGDSISVYTYDNSLEKDVKQGYPYLTAIDGEHEISVTNQAVSGQTTSSQYSVLQGKDLSVYDAITILIGTNDYGYNSTASAFKTNLKTMVEYIIAQKPSIKIGLMTLLHRASAWDSVTNTEVANKAGAVLSQFSQAIREVGQEYSIPVLDLWNECQCNFNYETYVTNYSSNGDGLHPTNEAHKFFIYPLYREFIKKLFAE